MEQARVENDDEDEVIERNDCNLGKRGTGVGKTRREPSRVMMMAKEGECTERGRGMRISQTPEAKQEYGEEQVNGREARPLDPGSALLQGVDVSPRPTRNRHSAPIGAPPARAGPWTGRGPSQGQRQRAVESAE